MATSIAVPTFFELDRAELRSLVELPPEASVSIFMPMQLSGPEVRQNAPRLKNLLRKASDQLNAASNGNGGAKALAGVLSELVGTVDELVREPKPGLALFARDGFLRVYKTPIEFSERLTVGERFQAMPLLEYLQGDGRFFVLAASQKDVRLLEGDKHSLKEVEVDGMPKNLVDALNIDEYVQSIQFHTEGFGGRNSINAGGGMFHGHGGGDQGDRKSDIMSFFRRLDDAVSAYFKNEAAPLVFAGVDYLFPIYQSVNHYRGLIDRPVKGNPEGWSAQQLHGAAWEIVKTQFEADRANAISQYGTLAAHGQGSDNLLQVLEATRIGRVGTLLVERGAQELAVVDSYSGEINLTDEDSADRQDLVTLAAMQTIGTSGMVFLLDRSEMPTDSPVAALYRY